VCFTHHTVVTPKEKISQAGAVFKQLLVQDNEFSQKQLLIEKHKKSLLRDKY